MKKIRIGVAGAGKMGVNHIRIVSELSHMFDFIGIYDPDPEKKQIAEKYDVAFYPSYEKLLADIDAVIIASPTSFHYDMALKAAEYRVNSLVEKPMAETVDDIMKMQKTFKEKGLILAVSCVERYSPVIRTLKDVVKEEKILAVEVHRCSPYDPRIFDVDVVSDLMIHDVDIVVNDIFGKMPAQIEAYGTNTFSDHFADYAHAILTFNNQVRAYITSSRSTQDKIRTICIHTRDAYIEADMLNKTLVVKRGVKYMDGSDHVSYRQYNVTEQIVLPNQEPLKEDIICFGRAVGGEDVFLVADEQVIRDMQVLDQVHKAIYEKWNNGGTLK